MKTKNILENIKDLSVKSLNQEVKNYLENYCFSTLDILLTRREILSLELDTLYDKIVVKKRGGYCFEHNKLFHYFLEDMGIKTKSKLARVVYGKDIDVPKTHRVIIINIEESDYLVDVGFGAHSPICLVPLNGDEVICANGSTYRVTVNNKKIFSFEKLRNDTFFKFYTFNMEEYTEQDFDQASYYSNTNPNSKHAFNLVLSINKENKVTKAILNTQLSTFMDGSKSEEKIHSPEGLKEILEEEFNIQVSDSESKFLFDSVPTKKL
jgi:N-hydroxyarylamine O-acetyltransferase